MSSKSRFSNGKEPSNLNVAHDDNLTYVSVKLNYYFFYLKI